MKSFTHYGTIGLAACAKMTGSLTIMVVEPDRIQSFQRRLEPRKALQSAYYFIINRLQSAWFQPSLERLKEYPRLQPVFSPYAFDAANQRHLKFGVAKSVCHSVRRALTLAERCLCRTDFGSPLFGNASRIRCCKPASRQVWGGKSRGGKICLPQLPEVAFTGKALPLPNRLRQPIIR